MIVSTVTTIGIQCSKCGELQFRTLSIFAFSHYGKDSFYCSCGAPILTLTSFERGNFGIEFPCIYCGESHFMLAKRDSIWNDKLLSLSCSVEERPIGYIGPDEQVIHSCEEIKKTFVQFASELVSDEEHEGEFDNFFIVYAVMEKISKLVERQLLGCRCGTNNLSVEILPDRIELVCQNCHGVGVIHTDNKDILRILDNMGSIYLEENTTWFLNDSYKGHNLVRNK